MPIPNQPGLLYSYLSVVDKCDEKLLVHYLGRDVYDFAYDPLLGSKYADFKWAEESRVALHGDWTLVKMLDQASASDNRMAFLWARPRTPQEIAHPVPFNVRNGVVPGEWMDYPWPPKLDRLENGKYLDVIPDRHFTRIITDANGNQVTTPRLQLDYALNQYSGLTWVETLEFLSPVPFSRDFLRVRKPDPQSLRFEFAANLGPDVRDIPQCLHPDIPVPELGRTKVHSTPATYGGALNARRVWARTNMTTWERHPFQATQTYENYMYHTVVKIAYPPAKDSTLKHA